MITLLKSKLQQVVVTQASHQYEGSITLDADLMEAAYLRPFERVDVNNFNGNRDTTYCIPAERGSGIVGINGALATRHQVGDKIHVLAWQQLPDMQYTTVTVVYTGDDNEISDVKTHRPCLL